MSCFGLGLKVEVQWKGARGRAALFGAALLWSFGGAGCHWNGIRGDSPASFATHPPTFRVDEASYALADPAETRIVINLDAQSLRLIDRNGAVLVESDASTGVPGHETPVGTFEILEKLPTKRSNRYGRYVRPGTGEIVVAQAWTHPGPRPEDTVYEGIEMPLWMRVTWDGIGIHQGRFPRGMRSSHGCIRMPLAAQERIFAKSIVGTPVVVETGSADD